MKRDKHYLYLSNDEFQLIFFTLISFKNKLISQDKYTDAVDDIILKLVKTGRKTITI